MYSLLFLENVPIMQQLKLEEALLRTDKGNWCLINSGTTPAIVMGISGKPEKLLNVKLLKEQPVPLIKRFSGGGTVYVDEQSFFVTLIANGKMSTRSILEFTQELYKPLFPGFTLSENDYCIGDRKFAGNAQYLQKDRWLHHSSFLWQFDVQKMDYLLLPEKQPAYRAQRNHADFLTPLAAYFSCKTQLLDNIKEHLGSALHAQEVAFPHEILQAPHRKSCCSIGLKIQRIC